MHCLLQRFRCYLEGSEFEILTDNQVLRYLFEKKDLSRREARWLALFGNFGIFPISLQKGRCHVLGDAPSRAPHAPTVPDSLEALISSISTTSFQFPTQESLENDQYFGPVWRALRGKPQSDRVAADSPHTRKIMALLPLYQIDSSGTLRTKDGALCVPRSQVRRVLEFAHDAPTGGHFGVTKTLERLSDFA